MTREECIFDYGNKLEYSVLVGNVSLIIVLSLNYSGVMRTFWPLPVFRRSHRPFCLALKMATKIFVQLPDDKFQINLVKAATN